MTLFNLGSDNPLIRRVRRHRSVSTLFRRASQPAVPRSSPPGPALPGPAPETPAAVVQAEMPSVRGLERPGDVQPETPGVRRPAPENAGPVRDVPGSQPSLDAIPTAPPPARSSRPEDAQVAPEAPPAPTPSRRPEGQQVRTPEAPPRDAFAADEPAAPEPMATPEPLDTTPAPAEDEEASEITETVWQRLKTIFQRHQESAGNTEGQSPAPGEAPVPGDAPTEPQPTREAAEPQAAAPQGTAAEPATPSEPATVQRQAIEAEVETEEAPGHEGLEGETPESDTIDAGIASEPRGQRASEPELEAAPDATPPSSLPPADDGPPAAEDQPQPEASGPEDASRQTVLQEPPPEAVRSEPTVQQSRAEAPAVGEDSGPVASAPQQEAEPPAPAVAGRTATQAQAPVASPDAPEPAAARQPLQEVWDVQTTAQPPTPAPKPRRAPDQEPPPAVDATPQVQQVMRQAASGRPTRSSIEVIQPRRPRPATPPPEEPQPSEETAQRPDEMGTRPTLPAEITEAAPGETPAMRTPEAGETDSMHEAQTQETPSPPSPSDTDAPTMVETEIGPLPGDLWELIGEPVPTNEAPSPTESPVEPPPDARSEGALPTLAAPAIESKAPTPVAPSPSRPASIPTTVQRAEARTDVATETESQSPETEAGPDGGMDVDELARRVYGEVRRRLAVELERMRSYF